MDINTITWNDLPSAIQERFLNRARFLVSQGYVLDRTIDQIAEEIFQQQRHTVEDQVQNYVAGYFQ